MLVNDAALYAGLDRLLETIDRVTDVGLGRGAAHFQGVAQATTAYVGMSGATRGSTTGYAVSATRDGSAEAAAGFASAQAALTGFTGHQGKAVSEDSGVVLPPDSKGIILTSFTNYIDKLEIENAGAKAFLGPTLNSEADVVTGMVAQASKEGLG
jgi:hypothetical protein